MWHVGTSVSRHEYSHHRRAYRGGRRIQGYCLLVASRGLSENVDFPMHKDGCLRIILMIEKNPSIVAKKLLSWNCHGRYLEKS